MKGNILSPQWKSGQDRWLRGGFWFCLNVPGEQDTFVLGATVTRPLTTKTNMNKLETVKSVHSSAPVLLWRTRRARCATGAVSGAQGPDRSMKSFCWRAISLEPEEIE